MTDYLLTHYKQRVRNLSLVPYADGRFEVSVNGTRIYSKLDTGVFPQHEDVRAALERQLAA